MEQSDFWASGITFSSLKELWVCELTQVQEMRKSLWLSLMMTKIRSNPAFFSFPSFFFFFLFFSFGGGVGGVEAEQGDRNQEFIWFNLDSNIEGGQLFWS